MKARGAGLVSRAQGSIRCHLGWAEGLPAKDEDSEQHSREEERKESRGRRRKREEVLQRNRKEQKRKSGWQ